MVRATRRMLGGKLAESSWLRFVLDHAPVVLFALDPQARVTLAEGRGLATLGLTTGAVVGKTAFEVFPNDPHVPEIVRRALSGEEFEIVTPVGEGRGYYSARFRPLRGPRGEVAGVVAVAVDVTPQRHALDALRQSEARLRLVTDQLPCVVWTTDQDLRVTGLAGRADHELARAVGQRLHHLGLSTFGVEAHEAALRGEAATYALTSHGRDYDVRVSPFVDEHGRTIGCLGLAVDITERRRAEAATLRLQEEHGLLLDAVPAMVCFRDRSGVIQRCNRAFAHMFGRTPQDVAGATLRDILPVDAARELDLDRQVFESGEPQLGEVHPCTRADGSTLWLRMDRIPIGEGPRPDAILVCCVDVTPLKQAEHQLASSLSLLQATLESTADGILVVNRAGKFVVHNERFVDLWKLPPEVLTNGDDAKALRAVLSLVADPSRFLARIEQLYAEPDAEGHDVIELTDGRTIERFSCPQYIGDEIVGRVWSFRDVTGQRRAEAERDRLLEAERRTRLRAQDAERWLRELVHGMDAIVWEQRAGSTDFTFVSNGGEAILGYPSARWLQPGFWPTIVHPDDLPRALAACHATENQRVELRVRASDGRLVWLQDNVCVVRDQDGAVTLLRGVMVDVTARKRAEEALKSSEARLRALVDNTPNVGIQRYAADGRVLEWNPASEVMYGVRAQDVLGRRLEDVAVLDPSEGEELRRTLAEVARTGQPRGPAEWTVRRGDGSTGVVLSTIFAVPGDGTDEFICMDVDVTARRRAEEAVARHAARLEVLARVSRRLDDAAFDVGAIARALAVGIHEAVGDGTVVLISPENGSSGAFHAEGADAALERIARERALLSTPASFTGQLLDEVAPSAGLSSLLIVPLAVHGRVLGTLCVGRPAGQRPHGAEGLRLFEDLAERAALGVENARHFHAAQRAIRERDEFLSVASHELRTPLQSLGLVVQGLSAAVARGGLAAVPADVLTRGLGTVVRQEQRLARLVDALLDVTRLASGQLHLELEDVDLRHVVGDVLDMFKGELSAAQCEVRTHLPDAPVVGRWDRNRLEQVVANLVSNAAKYGAGRPVEIGVRLADGSVELAVTDHGIGMTEDTRQQIFQRFKRGVSARHYGGLGLGLFITRQIIEALGGTVEVESRLGEGSTFRVTLPLGGPSSDEGGPR